MIVAELKFIGFNPGGFVNKSTLFTETGRSGLMRRISPDEGQIAAGVSDGLIATPERGFPSPHALKWLLTVLLVYFGLRLFFFAATISPFVAMTYGSDARQENSRPRVR